MKYNKVRSFSFKIRNFAQRKVLPPTARTIKHYLWINHNVDKNYSTTFNISTNIF